MGEKPAPQYVIATWLWEQYEKEHDGTDIGDHYAERQEGHAILRMQEERTPMTEPTPVRWVASFHGREVGAIGVLAEFVGVEVTGRHATRAEAELALYETHEHISIRLLEVAPDDRGVGAPTREGE